MSLCDVTALRGFVCDHISDQRLNTLLQTTATQTQRFNFRNMKWNMWLNPGKAVVIKLTSRTPYLTSTLFWTERETLAWQTILKLLLNVYTFVAVDLERFLCSNTLLSYYGSGVVSLSDTRGQKEPQKHCLCGHERTEDINSITLHIKNAKPCGCRLL